MDGAIGSLEALETIAQKLANSENFATTFDNGIRGAADVVKALALGTKFVFIGRLWIWELSIMGETGVRHVLKGLLADLDISMNCAGLRSIDDIDKSLVESLPKSYSLLNEKSRL